MSVCEKVGELKRADVVNAIVKNAERKLKQLRSLCGDAIWEETTLPDRNDSRWNQRTDGVLGSRMLRIIAPLSYCLEVFRCADVGYFLRHGGVRCDWRKIPNPMQTVWSIWWSGVTAWRDIDWREIGGNYLEVKAVELALNYTKHMTRFHLRPPILSDVRGQDRQQRARQMLTMWTKVMQSAKEAQMQMLKEDDWPPYEFRPWEFVDLQKMPIVLWIAEQRGKK